MSGFQLRQLAFVVIIYISTVVNSLPLSDGTSNTGIVDNHLVNAVSHHPRNLIGNNLQLIGLASQNLANNNGNTAGSASHSSGTQNTAQQNVADAQSIDVLKNIDVAANPLVLV